ncbi:MAG TPA: PPK2 family polyphosphate kinase [Nevskiaceae bacterium]|nr:PPK2 family polyphosphate kinase [Nevskiaceae bacterium]
MGKRDPQATAVKSPYLVSFDGEFKQRKAATAPPKGAPDKEACKERLGDLVDDLEELQRLLYADDRHSLLLVFQAMDAAGKDSTIRAVLSGVDPSGCQVYSFKAPSHEDLDHDFLWRTARNLPERGRIGVFNRSYYEEVLVVRAHPEYLESEKLPELPDDLDELWEERYASIRDHEKHLARNGTVIIKFWLNVSREEQRQRFLSRLESPEKNWKFNEGDVAERKHWGAYMQAYEAALNATSRPWAPWYAIPADDKPYLRMCVADVIVRTLQELELSYPKLDAAQRKRFRAMRKSLERE